MIQLNKLTRVSNFRSSYTNLSEKHMETDGLQSPCNPNLYLHLRFFLQIYQIWNSYILKSNCSMSQLLQRHRSGPAIEGSSFWIGRKSRRQAFELDGKVGDKPLNWTENKVGKLLKRTWKFLFIFVSFRYSLFTVFFNI